MTDLKQKKEVTIHKANEIIRGGNTYSLVAQKLANAVYYHVQRNRLFHDEVFSIPIPEIRLAMGLENSNRYMEAINKVTKELAQPIVLYNLDSVRGYQKKGQDSLWKVVQFLIEPEIVKIGKEKYLKAQMSPTMRVLLANSNDGNFTQLVLNTHLSKVKSKHSYILYEYLKSFENFKVVGNKVEFSFERLDKMFNLDQNKSYPYFSSFKNLLLRCIDDLNQNTDMKLKLSVNKELKKYYVHRLKSVEGKKAKAEIETYKSNSPLGKITKEEIEEIRNAKR